MELMGERHEMRVFPYVLVRKEERVWNWETSRFLDWISLLATSKADTSAHCVLKIWLKNHLEHGADYVICDTINTKLTYSLERGRRIILMTTPHVAYSKVLGIMQFMLTCTCTTSWSSNFPLCRTILHSSFAVFCADCRQRRFNAVCCLIQRFAIH